MALIQVNFISQTLRRTVPINVILPVDKFSMQRQVPIEKKTYKTLYLLHGIFGNYTDWLSGTRIQQWAEEKELAVVMPSGENAFYIDQESTHSYYGRFIGEELVDITRKMFPLSEKREDTFIGGLSMGGYGALRNGLKYHDTFGRIIDLSGALHLLEDPERPRAADALERPYFGDLAEDAKGDKNPRVLIKQLAEKHAEEGTPLPEIFIACGTEDSMLPYNRLYRDLCREAGFDVTYYESAGGHTWEFWDEYIQKAVEWLPD